MIAVVCLLLEILGDGGRMALSYNRDALASGELWRLVTAHFVHLSLKHALLNMAGLALVVWIVGHAFRWPHWLFVALISVVMLNVGFWFLSPELEWYVGFSGLLNGILAAGLVIGISERDPASIVLGVLVVAKLSWEQVVGPLPGSESTSGGAVVVIAHIYGAVGGLLATLLLWHRVRPAASL